MVVGGSTCGAKLGGANKNNRKNGGNLNLEPGVTVMPQYLGEVNVPPAVIGGGKRIVKRVAKPVAKPVAKRVAKRVVKRGGNDGMPSNQNDLPSTMMSQQGNQPPPPHLSPHLLENKVEKISEISETSETQEMSGGSRQKTNKGGSSYDMPKSLGGAKKRVLTPYNKFVKKHFPAMKLKYPDYKAPQIMKKIADEWKKTK